MNISQFSVGIHGIHDDYDGLSIATLANKKFWHDFLQMLDYHYPLQNEIVSPYGNIRYLFEKECVPEIYNKLEKIGVFKYTGDVKKYDIYMLYVNSFDRSKKSEICDILIDSVAAFCSNIFPNNINREKCIGNIKINNKSFSIIRTITDSKGTVCNAVYKIISKKYDLNTELLNNLNTSLDITRMTDEIYENIKSFYPDVDLDVKIENEGTIWIKNIYISEFNNYDKEIYDDLYRIFEFQKIKCAVLKTNLFKKIYFENLEYYGTLSRTISTNNPEYYLCKIELNDPDYCFCKTERYDPNNWSEIFPNISKNEFKNLSMEILGHSIDKGEKYDANLSMYELREKAEEYSQRYEILFKKLIKLNAERK